MVDFDQSWTVEKDTILSQCGWSPLEGTTFNSKITHTFVNGHLAYQNGVFSDQRFGERLLFNI